MWGPSGSFPNSLLIAQRVGMGLKEKLKGRYSRRRRRRWRRCRAPGEMPSCPAQRFDAPGIEHWRKGRKDACGSCFLRIPIWVWLKIQQEGLCRFCSMFPLTRVLFWYVVLSHSHFSMQETKRTPPALSLLKMFPGGGH